MAKRKKHSGYVALIGRTNVGKSTFLNNIMETKISIVSNKPQTTRKQILGIKTGAKGQIIFFDSPGIHRPHFKMNEKMMNDVHNSLLDADIILYFIEVENRREDEFALSLFQGLNKTVFLVINKIDKCNKGVVLERIDMFKDTFKWAEIVPISALNGNNIDLLEELLYKYLPEGEYLFPDEQYTLQSEKFYTAEIIREKILHITRDEIPYTTSVKVEEIDKKENVVYIRAEIYVETNSQKKILIGKKGNLVKNIGAAARKELEEYFEFKVFLDLFIKVVPGWRNSIQVLQEIEFY